MEWFWKSGCSKFRKFRLMKKARMGIISFIITGLAVILLVFLIKNGWDFQAAAQDMLALLRIKGKP